jgi:DUF4097 and DUF4098 domain-containing protein YvlB
MNKLWFAAFVLVGLALATPARADEWSKKYALTAKPELRVDANDGSIEITSANQQTIDARVTTSGWKLGAEVHVNESQNGNQVTVEVRVPRSHFHIGFGNDRRSVRIELRVPRQADLDIHTGDGHINSEAVAGRIRLDTGDGHITANGLAGEIRLHTGDGHIEGARFDGSLDADTGDGRMNVRGRFDALTLKTGDGSIQAEAERGSAMKSSWSLRSGDGSITLRFPQGLGAQLDAHTGDGHISVDFPVTVSGTLSKSTIRGKLGTGGPELTIRTGDGSIRLEHL